MGIPESAWQQSSMIACDAHNVGFLPFLKRRFSWSLSAKDEAQVSLVPPLSPLVPFLLFTRQWHPQIEDLLR